MLKRDNLLSPKKNIMWDYKNQLKISIKHLQRYISL